MAELEEPLIPNGLNAGKAFMNAFAIASQVNVKKQQLQEQLTRMQMQMGFQEQKHELDMDKLERDSYFKSANLQRAYDIANMNSAFKDRNMERLVGNTQDALAKKDANLENAGQYRDEMNAWGQKYADDLGGTEAQIHRTLIEDKYSTTLGTPEGKRQSDDFDRRIKSAQVQANQNSKTMWDLAQHGSKIYGVDMKDWGRGDDYWAKDPDGNRRMPYQMAPAQPGVPNSPLIKQAMTKQQVDAILAQDKKAGTNQGGNIKWSNPVEESGYQTMKDLHKQISRRGMGPDDGSLRTSPAPDVSGTIALPRNPAERYKGKVYQSAAGPVIWDGEHLIKQ